jgi:exodeoxyribonuclease V alpha subunit
MAYMTQQHSSQEGIEGSIERVTFHNEETGFCVLRVKVKGQRDLITVLGSMASVTPGEFIECRGSWFNDKKHGLQFKAQHIQAIPPATLDGIQKYLGSGMMKGIGAFFAKKLVQAFGEDVFDVIENYPERLTKLEGIGEKRKEQIVSAWAEQKAIRNIMVFLQSHGVGTARAVRIYKTYGDLAIAKVQENPYRLAQDIHGIGFKTADALAIRLGVPRDSILRAQAGVHYVLQDLCQQGHCAVTYQALMEASIALLEIAEPIIQDAIKNEIAAEKLILDPINEVPCIFSASLYHAEVFAVEHLKRILSGMRPWGEIDAATAIPAVEQKTGLQLSHSQKKAIETVLQHKLSIITGGPGVGKTTIVKNFLNIIRAKSLSIALCAPTGRAAKRLSESTGLTAKTIHRLLIFDPATFSFKQNQDNPLHIDVCIIDEASMIDVVLLYHLLKAIPDHAALIFIGDVDQLPSVGPGAVLKDMIDSNVIPTVRLTEIFRQAASSNIIVNAHRINQGEMPLPNAASVSKAPASNDFYTIYTDAAETLHDQLLELVSNRIPQYLGCHAVRDIQVLTPMNRGGLGARSLNVALQAKLNGKAEPKVTRYGLTLAPGDKVIQTVNNYDKDVFNGDIGFVTQINLEENLIKISFDHRIVEYDFNELDEVSLAYAISIHKSQGSEFPVVIMPMAMQHYMLLARNLLYTGVTRGKQLVVLIGEKKAVGMAVRNNQENKRLTKLAQRLKNYQNVL